MVLEFIALFLAGVLAGEEFVVRYGVHPALTALDDQVQIKARQTLIRRLRVVVPAVMVPAVLCGVVVLILDVSGPGAGFRWAGVLAYVVFLVVTFGGTVPINQKIGDWQPETPPSDWRDTVRRWERLDVVRSSAAILAFGSFLAAVALRLA